MPCPTLDASVQPDISYRASIELDELTKQIIFQFADETLVYDIITPVFKRNRTLRTKVFTSRGATGKTVGYFDNLRNNADTPTAQ